MPARATKAGPRNLEVDDRFSDNGSIWVSNKKNYIIQGFFIKLLLLCGSHTHFKKIHWNRYRIFLLFKIKNIYALKGMKEVFLSRVKELFRKYIQAHSFTNDKSRFIQKILHFYLVMFLTNKIEFGVHLFFSVKNGRKNRSSFIIHGLNKVAFPQLRQILRK